MMEPITYFPNEIIIKQETPSQMNKIYMQKNHLQHGRKMLEKQQRRQYDPKVMGESHDTISASLVVFQM